MLWFGAERQIWGGWDLFMRTRKYVISREKKGKNAVVGYREREKGT